MQTLEFIHVTYGENLGDNAPRTIALNRHLVRSQAMRDFRRKERQDRINANTKDVAGTLSRSQLIRKVNETAQDTRKSTNSCSLRLPLDVSTSKVWRHSFAQKLSEAWYPPEYRASVLGNISYTYDVLDSNPITTIQDTLLILNAASAGINRLLPEARRRYVATINLLRQQASGKASNMPVSMLGYLAMACLMCETFSAIAYGSNLVTWQKHVLGISTLVASFQHDSFAQAMGGHVIEQLRVAQLVYSLYYRRPFPAKLAIQALPVNESRLASLLLLAFQVPGILEIADSRIAGDTSHTYNDLSARLGIQKAALQSWLEHYAVSHQDENHSGCHIMPRNMKVSIINLTCETLCRICLLLIVESLVSLEHEIMPRRSPSSASDTCASDLLNTMAMLEKAAITPTCKARVMSAPLHFLSEYYTRHKDRAGLRLCQKIREDLEKQAPYLHWDALLPWCFLTLGELPQYDADAH